MSRNRGISGFHSGANLFFSRQTAHSPRHTTHPEMASSPNNANHTKALRECSWLPRYYSAVLRGRYCTTFEFSEHQAVAGGVLVFAPSDPALRSLLPPFTDEQ